MEGTSPWGYELIMTGYRLPIFQPREKYVESVCTFINLQDGVNTWSVEPTLADEATGTLLTRQVVLFPDGHYGIFSALRFFGLFENDWSQEGNTIDYSLGGGENTLHTQEPFTIKYARDEPFPEEQFEVDVRIPTSCGEEWPPPPS